MILGGQKSLVRSVGRRNTNKESNQSSKSNFLSLHNLLETAKERREKESSFTYEAKNVFNQA